MSDRGLFDKGWAIEREMHERFDFVKFVIDEVD